jgi:hypothetical protein
VPAPGAFSGAGRVPVPLNGDGFCMSGQDGTGGYGGCCLEGLHNSLVGGGGPLTIGNGTCGAGERCRPSCTAIVGPDRIFTILSDSN